MTYPKRCEEPLVLPVSVSLLQLLLDLLLGVLALRWLLEGIGADNTLQTLQLECVTGGEEVGVVDGLRALNQMSVSNKSLTAPDSDNAP